MTSENEIQYSEIQLATKLLNTFHLNVPERKSLQGGIFRLSVIIKAAEICLDQNHVIPKGVNPEEPYDGVIIERRNDEIWIHKWVEVGMGKTKLIESRWVNSIREAVMEYLRSVGDGTKVDGVPIDVSR